MVNLLNGIFGLLLQAQDAGGVGDAGSFCTDALPILRIVGIIVFIIKVAVPIILIVVGMVDLAKAVGQKDENSIKTAQNLLVKRAIAAVLVFVVITAVGILFRVLGQEQYKQCMTCINNPFNPVCNVGLQ